jgi:hypothetical protein
LFASFSSLAVGVVAGAGLFAAGAAVDAAGAAWPLNPPPALVGPKKAGLQPATPNRTITTDTANSSAIPRQTVRARGEPESIQASFDAVAVV